MPAADSLPEAFIACAPCSAMAYSRWAETSSGL
jgi:hypothetical protein